MIELPPKFKQALGNGVRTSLYPLVRIYKDVRIDDPEGNEGTAWEDAEQIYLSIKETNVSGSAYKPLLLKAPSIRSSADIINNKYTISNVSLSISNAPFKGKIFSDDIQSLLNAVCRIYYCANGIDSIDDSLLVYTGTVRRFRQEKNSVTLELEDATQQMLSTKIPSALVGGDGDSEDVLKSEDIGKPYPMVYGHVDKSPVITRSVGQDSMGELEGELTEFNIDKKGREILGLWEGANKHEYGNAHLTSSHTLVQNGYINKLGTLSVYENDFIPITSNLDYSVDWSYYVDGITDGTAEGFNRISANVDEVYYFHQGTSDSSASIKFNAEAFIKEGDLVGIPTRVYRPLDAMVCVNHRYNNTPTTIEGVEFIDQNRIYGFTHYDGISRSYGQGDISNFKPWKQADAMDFAGHYYDNWNNGDETWWMPTDCDENDAKEVTVTTNIDLAWKIRYPETKGLFPVNYLQDGFFDKGVWIISKNEDAESGFAYVKLFFKDNIGTFPATSKIVYDAQYHTFAGMENQGAEHMGMAAEFFSNSDNLEYTGYVLNRFARGFIDHDTGAFHELSVPNKKQDWVHIDYGNQQNTTGTDLDATEDTVELIGGFQILSGFNSTTEFQNINFGSLKLPQYNDGHDDIGYCSAQLFNFYLLQDAVVDQPLNKDFYADVKGRLGENVDIFCTTGEISFVGGFQFIPLIFTEHYDIVVRNYSIGDSVSIEAVDGGAGEVGIIDNINTSDKIITIRKDTGMINVIEGNTYFFDNLPSPIRTAPKIMRDILKDELGYIGEINIPNDFDLFQDQYKINNDFTLSEQKEAKEIFGGLFESSLAIPSYNAKGEFKIIPIHQLEIDNWDEYNANGTQAINSNAIDNQHILTYSFGLTKLEDVKNQINVKYKKNYASGNFDEETGYIFYDVDGNQYESYEDQSQKNYPDDPTKHYSLDYYGLKLEEAKLDIETEYIRDSVAARKLQKRLLNWYANQHLILKVDLPISYMNLEVGDYIHFDELIGGKLAFGYDYTKHHNKNGQVAYKYFFITKINKSLTKINIEGIQVHRGEYGFWESWDENYGDTGGNDGDNDFDIEDYEDDEMFEEEFYWNVTWASIPPAEIPDNNINLNPTLIIDTNLIGEFDYKIWITDNSAPFEYGNPQTPAVLNSAPPAFELTGDYITVTENWSIVNGQVQGGTLQLKSQFSPPDVDENGNPHGNIEGYVEISHPDTGSMGKSFFQPYIEDPTYNERLGDWNADGTINVLDVVGIVTQIILAGEGEASDNGDWTVNSPQSDFNQDGTVNILDVVAMINVILAGEG